MKHKAPRFTIGQARKLGVPESALSQIPTPSRKQTQNPQSMLFNALREHYDEEEMVSEARHLIPSRKFRVDIYFPKIRFGVEVDGWTAHGKHLTDYKRCRARQNIFTAHDIPLYRVPAGNILKDLEKTADEVRSAIECVRRFRCSVPPTS